MCVPAAAKLSCVLNAAKDAAIVAAAAKASHKLKLIFRLLFNQGYVGSCALMKIFLRSCGRP